MLLRVARRIRSHLPHSFSSTPYGVLHHMPILRITPALYRSLSGSHTLLYAPYSVLHEYYGVVVSLHVSDAWMTEHFARRRVLLLFFLLFFLANR